MIKYIWNKFVDKLQTSNDKEERIDSFMSLIYMEDEMGDDEVDKLILKRRKQNEDHNCY